jgi:Cu(I)/Ag(I) efflux system membrane protein CusA/SilA
VYLLWLLGYNFSVAVWVGFIALFGTAVQTGVVMVIYLEEALDRKRIELGGSLTRAALRDAVVEGALLRLRPKVMTVATVVAGLLPIMWSSRVGAEVMRPLATPVLGGMVSSLVHVLIVTPVIFFWLRERQLGLQRDVLPDLPERVLSRRVLVPGIVTLAFVGGLLAVWRTAGRGGGQPGASVSGSAIVQTVRSGDVEIVLRSPQAALRQGRNDFTIEFRRPDSTELLDVGTVRASGNMAMPGMVMSSGLNVVPSDVPGRYRATAEFGMSGTWQMALEWNGPAGQGSVTFQGSVQ